MPKTSHGGFAYRYDKTTQHVLARKNVQKTTFKAAEIMRGPWNQQCYDRHLDTPFPLHEKTCVQWQIFKLLPLFMTDIIDEA